MLLSRSSEYAVQALLYIAKSPDRMILAKEISERQGLALPFLGKILLSLVLGTIIIFTFGVGYLGSIIGYDKALAAGLYPFIPSEFFKIALALFLIPTIWKYANR